VTKPYYSPNAIRLRAIENLEAKLTKATTDGEREPLIEELRRLRREQKAVAVRKKKKKPSAKLPLSMRETIKAEREKAHGISGFRSIRVHFVQGGKAGGK
jgi:hypothetical protein